MIQRLGTNACTLSMSFTVDLGVHVKKSWEEEKGRNQKVHLTFRLFPAGAIRAPHVVHSSSSKSPVETPPPQLRCKPHRPAEWVKRQQQCEQYGTVRTPRTGTTVIRSAHNGSAQVAQVVVCHALCAAREIERKAFPPSWQSPKHVCVCEKEKNRSQQPDEPLFNHVSIHMSAQQIKILFGNIVMKVKFISKALLHPRSAWSNLQKG